MKKSPGKRRFPRARINPSDPTSREKQEHEDSGHAVNISRSAACVEGGGVGGQHRTELLDEERESVCTFLVIPRLDCRLWC